ncbi:uncharacterized protein SCHCODRAFT_02216684 [Schizophyllum commune H4-8]|uniref:uncharacterized protein n=1 Tax=Schizophyllum commune (strain H4-8 / FGSC 9210) TaxID=578458 RepID=UPI00215FA773|nr:uncharacterized protein SCHCODRAFT_02216684 [Schizophyllum commune H4-8]KAI5894807.1 hypothetical protein SCHCODRAFT_02216684 [Schizophyllum commune H4-8]
MLIDALEAGHVTDTAMRSFRASPARMAREVQSAEVREKVEKERLRKEIRVAERAAGGTQCEGSGTRGTLPPRRGTEQSLLRYLPFSFCYGLTMTCTYIGAYSALDNLTYARG